MSSLDILFSAKNGGKISGTDTVAIDAALVSIDASEIPLEQIQNVTDYINIELLQNEVPNDTRKGLENLLIELQQA